VSCSPTSVNCNVTSGNGVTFTFTVGSLPGYVSTADSLSITLQGTYNGTPYTAAATCGVYLNCQTPTAPQAVPWLDVVADSCTWAYGDTTAAQVARDETLGLFDSGYFQYRGTSYWTTFNSPTVFLLTKFLADGPDSPGNCVDVSDYLTICENSQGLSFSVQEYTGSPLSNNTFTTNALCPIGSSPGNYGNYSAFTWYYHQLAFSGGNAFDACAAEWKDLNGDPYANAPYNWNWAGIWQTPIPVGDFLGIVAAPNANGQNTPNASSNYMWVQGAYTPTVQ
jgi:hypothetical protein